VALGHGLLVEGGGAHLQGAAEALQDLADGLRPVLRPEEALGGEGSGLQHGVPAPEGRGIL
jgi:hypothetical protein